jgi:hypothetical protein
MMEIRSDTPPFKFFILQLNNPSLTSVEHELAESPEVTCPAALQLLTVTAPIVYVHFLAIR